MTPAACAKKYHESVKTLALAEKRHSENVDLLHQAAAAKKATEVYRLRSIVRDSEAVLIEKLNAACLAHTLYWRSRLEVLRADALRAVFILRTYDTVARLTGDPVGEPHKTLMLEVKAVSPDQVVNDDGVSHEGPDSEMLNDYMGNWR